MALSALLLAACAQGRSQEEVAMDRVLSAYDARESAVDLTQCAAAYGQNYKTLRRCVDARKSARQAQLDALRQALRERRLRTSQTSCSNPVTGAAEMCQDT